MNAKTKQAIKIAVFGLLTLCFLALTILELLPGKTTELTVREPVTVVSAPVNVAAGMNENAVTGVLFNDSTDAITVDQLNVTLKKGKAEKEVQIPLGVTIAPHTEYRLAYSEMNVLAYSEIENLSAEIGGVQYALANAEGGSIGAGVLILLACLLVFGFLLYRSILVRVYIHQEEQLKKE